MPLTPMDEFLAHQTTDTFDTVFTSDRNFYDRYYFNCHPSSDELFMVAGMGQYPNLGVTDAFVTVSHGNQQYTVRASRELNGDRFDTSVGPFSIEVVEGLRRLRLRCEPNEWGLEFDLLFEGTVRVLEEPKSHSKVGMRVTQDVARYAQVGTYTGSLTVAGQTYEVEPSKWQGARDHSWGIRPVGEPEPPGIRMKDVQLNRAGFYHNWLPMQFDDYMLKISLDEDSEGTRVLEEAVKVWNLGIDKADEHLGSPEIDIDYISGTREMSRSVLRLAPPGGGAIRSVNTPLRTVYLAAGSGYMPRDHWGHGFYQGAYKVEGITHDMSTQAERSKWASLNETLCRYELDTGEIGYGMHENLCLGTHKPTFDRPDKMAL